MQARRAIWLYVSLSALTGVLDGYQRWTGKSLSAPLLLASDVGCWVAVYLWYFWDATERGFMRTTALGGAVIAFWPIAVPVYLVRSRSRSERLKALSGFFGLGVVSLLMSFLASLPFTWSEESGANRIFVEQANQALAANYPAPDAPPQLLSYVRPTMPLEAVQKNLSGEVRSVLTVDATGHVSHVEIEDSPDDLLSAAVLAAMQQWKFSPWVHDGVAQEFRLAQANMFQVGD